MNDKTKALFVYVTAASREEAEVIASALICEKVAACVNILGEIKSIYEWNGVVEKATEVAMIAKTTQAGFAALEKVVMKHHSYECPCIVAWPLSNGHAPFLDWIHTSVQ